MKARDDEDLALPRGDLYLCFDGGRAGNSHKLFKGFKDRDGKTSWQSKKKFVIMYDETSLKKRRSRVRGTGTLRQIETLWAMTRGPLEVPTKQRLHYPGSNKSEGMAYVQLEDWKNTMCVSFKEKKQAYGKQRVAVGGPTEADKDDGDDDGVDDDEEEADDVPPAVDQEVTKSRDPDNKEPFCYQSLPKVLWEELRHSFCIEGLTVDFSPADGECAKAWLDKRSPYIAVCFNDKHVDLLYTHLTEYVLECLKDPKSPHFQAA